MNIWTEKADIEKMTSCEWREYRDCLVDEFYKRGYVLKPNIHCHTCDPSDDYVCLDCEITQIDTARGVI